MSMFWNFGASRRKQSRIACNKRLMFEPLEKRLLLTVNSPAILMDIKAAGNSNPHLFTTAGNNVFFIADDGTHGTELWKTDGTTAGTKMLRDISTSTYGNAPSELVNVNGTLYFSAKDATNGRELWKSDGTTAGTIMVSNIGPGQYDSNPTNLTNVGGKLFFFADDGQTGRELWTSDGTSSGTHLVFDITPGVSSTITSGISFADVSGVLMLGFSQGRLWRSDGTSSGTYVVSSATGNSQSLCNVNGRLFFSNNDFANGDELWISDGTSLGTQLVKDINPATGAFGGVGSRPSNLTNVNGKLFFTAPDGTNGNELWTSDGTSSGTVLVRDIRTSGDSNPAQLTAVGAELFFEAADGINGPELWKSDGTSSGTQLVKEVRLGSTSPNLAALTNVNGTLYFSANDGQAGQELWTSDGTTSGTTRTSDIYQGTNGSYPGSWITLSHNPDRMAVLGSQVFFAAQDASRGVELWTATGPIVPAKVSLSLLGNTLAENGGTATVVVRLDKTIDTAVDVTLSFSGTASSRSDYTLSSALVSIPAGQISASRTITAVSDLTHEGNESIIIDINSVSTVAVENGIQQVTTTIVDDDSIPLVDLFLTNSSLNENNGTTVVGARLSNPTVDQVTVVVDFSGSAEIGKDFTRSSNQIVILPGQTSGAIVLQSINDTQFEPDEQIVVDMNSLSSTNGIENGTQQVIATILNDDLQPRVSLSMASTPLVENGGTANVVATLTNPSSQDVIVDLIFDGTATKATDYTLSATQIVVPAGNVSASITLTAIDDALLEGSELVIVSINSVTGGTANGVQSASLTIADNEAPNVTLALTSQSFAENAGTTRVRATLDKTASQAVLVDLVLSGIGSFSVDYSASSTSVVIPAGALTGEISLMGIDDAIPEGPESVVVDINKVSLGNELGTQRVTASIIDDASDSFQVSGNQLTITGTPGDDTIAINYSGSTTLFTATINGTTATFSSSTIVIDGAGGKDSLDATLSSLADTATLGGLRCSITSTNYSISIDNTETKVLRGSPNDSVDLNDTGSVMTTYLLPTHAIMQDDGGGYYNSPIGFGNYTANAVGNNDQLYIYGDRGNQAYTATPTKSTMPVGSHMLVGNNFLKSYAYGSGGSDTATYSGSSADETMTALAGYTYVKTSTTTQYFDHFAQLSVNGNGGTDTAIMYDSAGNDTFVASDGSYTFSGTTFRNIALGYDRCYAFQYFGGKDTATLNGGAGDDRLTVNSSYLVLVTPSSRLQATGFSTVIVNAGTGNDIATFADSTGNDSIVASGNMAELTFGNTKKVRAVGFDSVFATTSNGGVDRKTITNPLLFTIRFSRTWV